jgi:uncharacterized protein (TIGR03083 family)
VTRAGVTRRLGAELEAFLAQARILADWLAGVPAAGFAAESALPGWDLRTLLGHVVLVQDGLARVLRRRSPEIPLPAAQYVRNYRRDVEAIAESTYATTGEREPRELIASLRDAMRVREAANGVADRASLAGPRGPITALDWVITRTVDLVVHCDDFTRSLPERDPVPLHRAALATTTRALAEWLAAAAPGRSVEVRIPPFAAVQVVEGLRHTRGTPPNVVETDPITWLRVATGRQPFVDAVATGGIRASGTRADLSEHLPLLS